MSSNPEIEESLRQKILSHPDVILEDADVMNALIAANDRAIGANVVDLRGIAMDRMGTRLDQLENTHRSVIAAAYENLAGTNQIHRAILRLMEPVAFDEFLTVLGGEIADMLRVDALRLVVESAQDDTALAAGLPQNVLTIAAPGFIDGYLAQSRQGTARTVTLRPAEDASPFVYGAQASLVRSEACLVLDFGPGRLPGLLVMGAQDPQMFAPQQGVDLLVFFAGVFERAMRRWLS